MFSESMAEVLHSYQKQLVFQVQRTLVRSPKQARMERLSVFDGCIDYSELQKDDNYVEASP